MDSTELQALCHRNPRAKGLCVIFANSRGNLPDMPLLKGVKTDLLNMQRTFETLKFAVLSHQDCSATQMMSLFHDISTFSEYPPSYRRIAVVFAGHGMEGSLCAHDGTVPIEEIIDQFQPANCHPSIGGIPKLFFIDACRGKRKMASVVVERGATAVPSKIVSPRGNILVAYSTLEGYKAHEVEEGGIWVTELSKQLLQDKSLTDVIINVNKTLQEKYQQDSTLSRYLQQPECIITINECINLLKESTEESPSLGETFSNYGTSSLVPKWTPQRTTSRPLGCEADNYGNDVYSSNVARGRPLEHPDVYQQLLDTFVKEKKFQRYKESVEPCKSGERIVYCTKIEGAIGGEVCVFQSDHMESEDESREQAAMKAVSFIQGQRTDRGAICSPPSITSVQSSSSIVGVLHSPSSISSSSIVGVLQSPSSISSSSIVGVLQSPSSISSSSIVGVLQSPSSISSSSIIGVLQSSSSITGDHRMIEEVPCEEALLRSSRNFKQELNEWCQRNKVQAPRDYKPTGQSYMCTITIEGREFAGKLCSRKKDAEEDAAMKAVQWLQRLQPTTPPSAGQPGSMRLKEYCEHHPEKKLTLSYELLPAPLNGPFQCRLTITSPLKGSKIEVTGDLCKSKQDAKHSAADKALQQLG